VAGNAYVEPFVRAAVAALLQVQAAGFDVPVPGGDERPRRGFLLGGTDLPAHRGHRVLHDRGGRAAQGRQRQRRVAIYRVSWGKCRCTHISASLIASAWRASTRVASAPVATRIFHRTFIRPRAFLSSRLYAKMVPFGIAASNSGG